MVSIAKSGEEGTHHMNWDDYVYYWTHQDDEDTDLDAEYEYLVGCAGQGVEPYRRVQ